jgi:hypothetical protein
MKGCLVALAIFVGIVVTLVVVATGLFWFNFYDINVRYRLTLEVKDGDQVKTGSSILEVKYSIIPDSLSSTTGGNDPYRRVVGYAPTVDLGEKALLFLTFANAVRTQQQIIEVNKRILCLLNNFPCLPFVAYANPGSLPVTSPSSQQKSAIKQLLQQSGPRDVPFVALPALARLPDNNHPWVKPISPSQLSTSFGSGLELNRVAFDDLAASFGPGVELKRVVLELTRDPITPPPAIWPEWLKEKCGAYSGTLC